MSQTDKTEVSIFSDGGCRGNPGIGAWAAILKWEDRQRVIAGAEAQTTNNRMEITAAIEGLKSLTRPCRVLFVSDSKYLIQGITEWIHGWKRKQWRTAAKKPVKNKELWQALDKEVSRHQVKWQWTRGHSGHPENEHCDEVVNELMDRIEFGHPAESLGIDERTNNH